MLSKLTSACLAASMVTTGIVIGLLAGALYQTSPVTVAQSPDSSTHEKRRPTPYEQPRSNKSCCIRTRDGTMCWACTVYQSMTSERLANIVRYGSDALRPEDTP